MAYLRTADSVSPSLTGADVTVSLLAYTVVYLVMFSAGVAMMVRIFATGPIAGEIRTFIESGRPKAPVQALPRAGTEG